jgi:hypothetical protein
MRNRSPKRASESKAERAAHYKRLADDYGAPRRGRYTQANEGRPMSGRQFWFQPLTLFILSLIALFFVSMIQLYRFGVFDPIFGPKSATVDTSSKRWQLDGRRAAPADAAPSERDESDNPPPAFEEIDAPPVTD